MDVAVVADVAVVVDVEAIRTVGTVNGGSLVRAADAPTAAVVSNTPYLVEAAGAIVVRISTFQSHLERAVTTHAVSVAKRSLPQGCVNGPACGPAAVSAHLLNSSLNQ